VEERGLTGCGGERTHRRNKVERETVDWVSDGLGLGINPSSLPMMINKVIKR